jgi:hypothetical protein
VFYGKERKGRLFLVLGIAALFLVLITGLTGCDSDPSYKYENTHYNQTSFTIQLDITSGDWHPKSIKIKPYSNNRVGSNTGGSFYFDWKTIDKGNGRRVNYDRSTRTFYEY